MEIEPEKEIGKDFDELESFVLSLEDIRFLDGNGNVVWSRFGDAVDLNKSTLAKYKRLGIITKVGLQRIYKYYPDKFDISKYKFGDEVEELTYPQIKKQTIAPYYYHFGEISKSDFGEKVKLYFQDVVEKFNNSNESFEIYMYLSRGKNEALVNNRKFRKQQKKYFDLLFDLFKQKEIKKYNRILVLPIEQRSELTINIDEIIKLEEEPKRPDEQKGKFDCIKEALDLVFLEEFEHLWKCLCLDGKEYNFKLFVHKQPSRLYSFGILDKSILIKEHDRYDEHGFAQPDMLYVYEKNGKVEDTSITEMISTYQDVINEAVELKGIKEQSPVWKINKSIFKSIINKMFEVNEERIKKIEQIIAKYKEHNTYDDFYWLNLRDILKNKRKSLSAKAELVNGETDF